MKSTNHQNSQPPELNPRQFVPSGPGFLDYGLGQLAPLQQSIGKSNKNLNIQTFLPPVPTTGIATSTAIAMAVGAGGNMNQLDTN